MRVPRRPFPSAPALLAGLLLAALLLLPACNGGGGKSLGDTGYWRALFSRGEGVDAVVSHGAAAVPLLTTLLGDSNVTVVTTAALAAQQIGEPAAALVPALLEATRRHPQQPNTREAIKAMKGEAVQYLLPLIESGNEQSMALGVDLLNMVGESAAPAMEPLMRIVEGTASTELKRAALVTLGSIGRPAVPLIDRLNEFAKAHDDLRNDAAMAIKRIRTAEKVIKKGGDR